MVAAMATLSSIGCDPYIAADTSAPNIIGVMMVDTSYNTWNYTGMAPPDSYGCIAPYEQVAKTWADVAFPGLCNPGNAAYGIPTVCPVNCYPPRVGAAYAPLYTGNMAGNYEAPIPGGTRVVTYSNLMPASAKAWRLGAGLLQSKVPPNYLDWQGDWMTYGQIRILFNKTMNPASIQPDPLTCAYAKTPTTLRVQKNGSEVTGDYAVCYIPNSDTSYWGASLTVTPPGDFATLDNNATYRVFGTVTDQQGNSLDIDVQVVTGNDLADPPLSVTYSAPTPTYKVGTAITSNTATTTGGQIVAFSISPASATDNLTLNTGLKFSTSTGTISGTPTLAAAQKTYTVSACNYSDFDTFDACVSTTVKITVTP